MMRRYLFRISLLSMLAIVGGSLFPPSSFERAYARAPKSAQLMSMKGDVSVNGNPVSAPMTLASGSQISTGRGAYASMNLAGVGQVYIGENTEFTLSMTEDKVMLDLKNGVVRAIKSSAAMVQVVTNRCAQVDVARGTVNVFGAPEATAPMLEAIGSSEMRKYSSSQYMRADSREMNDFRVATFDCALAPALPPLPQAAPPVAAGNAAVGGVSLPVLLAVAGGVTATAIAIPLALDDDDDNALSPSRP
jgi:hypothetical protein